MSNLDYQTKIRSTIGAYVKAFADNSAEAASGLYTEHATLEDPVGSPVIRGIKDIHDFYVRAMETNAKIEVLNTPAIAGAFSATPIRVSFHYGGNDLSVEVISVMSFNDEGKILTMTAYFDPAVLNE